MVDQIDRYRQTFIDAGNEWNVDPVLLMALAKHEGGGDPNARGRSGEIGMTQIMPGTARHLGMTDPHDPVQQIWAAAKYMDEALRATNDNPTKALLYYNGGPGMRGDRRYPGYVAGNYAQYAKANTGSMTDASPAPADSTPATKAPADMTDAEWLDAQAKTYPGLAGPNAEPATGKDAAVADKGDAPSADDLLARMRKLAPGPTEGATGGEAAPGTQTPAGGGAPSADDLLRRMTQIAPAAPEPKPGEAPGGPKAGEQVGVYSRAGSAAGDIPGQRPTATSPTPTPPPASAPGPGERGVVGNLLAAGQEGYANTPAILTPAARQAVEGSGWVGRNLLNPALDAAGAVLGAGGAVGGVIGQGAYEAGKAVGGDAAGRDAYALSQVLPVAATMLPPGTKLPGAVGRSPELPPKEMPPNYVAGVAEVSPEAKARMAGNPTGTAEPIPPPPQAGPTGGAAGAQYAGRAAPMTQTERITALEKDVQQSAEDRAGPQLQDDTRYVKDIPDRTLAAQDFSDSRNALDEKTRIGQNADFRNKVEAINRDRNKGMVDLLKADAKDEHALEAAHETRKLVSPDEMGVFANEQPVDASANLAAIDKVLQSRAGKRDAVTAVLNKVRNSFFDKDGNLETSPSQLYGVRQNITDLLQKGVKGTTDEADAVRASKAILTGFLPELDKTITGGAPDFQRYLQAWHELSKPIDRMEFLQKYQTGSKKITGVDGYLIFNKVQKMLDDVLQGNKARAPGGAKLLTDDEIGNLVAVRNELAAQQLKDRLASVKGSDTFQQINRAGAFSGPVGNALGTLARMGGIIGSGGTANLLYEHGIRPGVARRREARIARETAARENQLLGGLPPQK